MMKLDNETSGAVISVCEKYRYRLWRMLQDDSDIDRKTCLFVMLNPSTADGTEDDPTIRRCMRFASDWNYTMLEVVNLFSVRCTDPKLLPHHIDQLCGPEHGRYLSAAISDADLIICAWGKEAGTQRPRTAWDTLSTIRGYNKVARCLKQNKDGSPAHPLYLKASLEPMEYKR